MLREKFDVINVLPLSLSPTLIKHKKANPVTYTEAMSSKSGFWKTQPSYL